MNYMKNAALALLALGAAALILSGVFFLQDRNTTQIGPVELTTQSHQRAKTPLLVGLGALVAGAALLVSSRTTAART